MKENRKIKPRLEFAPLRLEFPQFNSPLWNESWPNILRNVTKVAMLPLTFLVGGYQSYRLWRELQNESTTGRAPTRQYRKSSFIMSFFPLLVTRSVGQYYNAPGDLHLAHPSLMPEVLHTLSDYYRIHSSECVNKPTKSIVGSNKAGDFNIYAHSTDAQAHYLTLNPRESKFDAWREQANSLVSNIKSNIRDQILPLYRNCPTKFLFDSDYYLREHPNTAVKAKFFSHRAAKCDELTRKSIHALQQNIELSAQVQIGFIVFTSNKTTSDHTCVAVWPVSAAHLKENILNLSSIRQLPPGTIIVDMWNGGLIFEIDKENAGLKESLDDALARIKLINIENYQTLYEEVIQFYYATFEKIEVKIMKPQLPAHACIASEYYRIQNTVDREIERVTRTMS